MIFQIEKFIGDESKEKWLRYLGVLTIESETNDTDNTKYACRVCGRDLTVTLSLLQNIFSDNKDLTQTQADLFNKALKEGKFNTCKMQAHFFSQVFVETQGFSSFIEGAGYSFDKTLDLHSAKVDVQKTFMKQSFFDENKHLDYFYIRVLKNDETGDQIGLNYKTYKKGDFTITIPTGNPYSRKIKEKEKGIYTKYAVPKDKREAIAENFFDVVYSQTNGNTGISSKDGSKYRGRGAIQLTGRSIYSGASLQANQLFKDESFNWETNYEDVSSKDKDCIYSAVAYFHFRYKIIMKYPEGIDKINDQIPSQVTYDVNGGFNDLDKREAQYEKISKNIYQLTQCKPKTNE